jgi:hypothetical protein
LWPCGQTLVIDVFWEKGRGFRLYLKGVGDIIHVVPRKQFVGQVSGKEDERGGKVLQIGAKNVHKIMGS